MAIDKRLYEQRIVDQMMRERSKEFEDALTDSIVYGQGVMQGDRRVQPQVPQYSMAEIVLMDGTSQTFMLKASTNIVQHLTKEMKEKGFLTMWNDTDVLCIRADQVKQFALRAFTQQEK
jgi:hypothetical protein